ncbi:hypothetical protein BKP37_14500 [Anaerobacillus alkalilacustris]|uniref:C4-dicarboxylate ABC transporter n=1 Tax=Anaerobacillus alkalilacustris TaxID=393763 RepID=A0A1S2LK67_9BACI|nr:TRAP transporter substrate-binding protein [Anaerobacillus alkalilacustris]OIJ12087.1 hypothetical protein BKP37_14500 [Anaerobacillus alkalilacustris]
MNIKYRSLFYSILFVLGAILTACSNSVGTETDISSEAQSGSSKPEVYKWSLGINTTEGSVRDVTAKKFKEIVEEKTDGRLQIEIHLGESLGTEQEMINMVQVGALELQLAGGLFANIVPEYNTLSLPFIVDDYDEAYAVLDGPVGDRWKELASERGFKVLAHTELGFAQITTNNKPIYHPDDLKGLRMRSPNEAIWIESFRELGSAVSTMPFTEVYMALSQGVVDGQFNPPSAIYETNFHEVQDYLALTNHFYWHVNFIMNDDLWNSLDEELQEIIQEAAYEARDLSRAHIQKKDTEMLEVLKDEFIEITQPDIQAFRDVLEPKIDSIAKTIPAEAVEETYKFLEEYRKAKN